MKYLLSSALALILVLGNSYGALAQSEVTFLAPSPIREQLETLIKSFESKTNYKVNAAWGSGLGTKEQVAKGEGQDVSIMYAPFPEALASGHIVAGSAKTIASLHMAVAVRKGAARPDISTPEAVKRTFLAAKSISTVDPAMGSGGIVAQEIFRKLGISDQVKPKMVFGANGGVVHAAVAKGEAEMAVRYLNELNRSGLDIVGRLPREVSTPGDVVGFISTHAKNPAGAKALLDYLASSPEAAQVFKEAGMEPAR